MDAWSTILICLLALILFVQALGCFVRFTRARPEQVSRFTEDFVALNVVQYIHVNSNRYPAEREHWQQLLVHMRCFVKARGTDKIFYQTLRTALHLYGNLPLSSSLHRLIDELFFFVDGEAETHGVTDLNIVDGVSLCKKIMNHPLLA